MTYARHNEAQKQRSKASKIRCSEAELCVALSLTARQVQQPIRRRLSDRAESKWACIYIIEIIEIGIDVHEYTGICFAFLEIKAFESRSNIVIPYPA